MAKRKTATDGDTLAISADNYRNMVNVMLELAFRGEEQEGIIMRAAKAGGITEVTKEITRRRMYAKKQGFVRVKEDAETQEPKPKRASKRTKRTKGNTPTRQPASTVVTGQPPEGEDSAVA